MVFRYTIKYSLFKEEVRMTTIFNVAAYILELTGTVTTMKLQKLAYYSQAYCLATTGNPLFCENFQAWRNGPVAPTLFSRHRGKFLIRKGEINLSDIEQSDSNILTDDQKRIIEKVCDKFGAYSGSQLSERTHKEAPWSDLREGVDDSAVCSKVITKDSLKEYYTRNPLF